MLKYIIIILICIILYFIYRKCNLVKEKFTSQNNALHIKLIGDDYVSIYHETGGERRIISPGKNKLSHTKVTNGNWLSHL